MTFTRSLSFLWTPGSETFLQEYRLYRNGESTPFHTEPSSYDGSPVALVVDQLVEGLNTFVLKRLGPDGESAGLSATYTLTAEIPADVGTLTVTEN